jgi:hypothetical protein
MAKYEFPLLGLSYTPGRNSIFFVHTKTHIPIEDDPENVYEVLQTFMVTGKDVEEVKLHCLFTPGIQGIQSLEEMLIKLKKDLEENQNGNS